eukprot:1630272-Rhodomonas_salina.1
MPGSNAFMPGFQCSAPASLASSIKASCSRSGMLLGLRMAIEGAVTADIQRNFGDKFFLKAEYTIEGIPKPRTWTFRRSWQDFKKLDKWIRSLPSPHTLVPLQPAHGLQLVLHTHYH